jgi:hypothetical protein
MHARKRRADRGDTSPTLQTTSDRRMGESLFDIDHNNELFGNRRQPVSGAVNSLIFLGTSRCVCGTTRQSRALNELDPHSEQFK